MDKVFKSLLKEVKPNGEWVNSPYYNLQQASSKTKGGFTEEYIAEIFRNYGHKAERTNKTNQTKAYDILLNDSIKVEVKLAFANYESRIGKIVNDCMRWQHLKLEAADIFVFVGINPTEGMNIKFRLAGWRKETGINPIVMILSQKDLHMLESVGLIKPQGRQEKITSQILLREINYGEEYTLTKARLADLLTIQEGLEG